MTDTDNNNDNDNDNGSNTMSDLECREAALGGVRDGIAPLQGIPAAGLDSEKHETLREILSDLTGLERALTNEVSQMTGDEGGDRDGR